jgi:hypothetical protein
VSTRASQVSRVEALTPHRRRERPPLIDRIATWLTTPSVPRLVLDPFAGVLDAFADFLDGGTTYAEHRRGRNAAQCKLGP